MFYSPNRILISRDRIECRTGRLQRDFRERYFRTPRIRPRICVRQCETGILYVEQCEQFAFVYGSVKHIEHTLENLHSVEHFRFFGFVIRLGYDALVHHAPQLEQLVWDIRWPLPYAYR